MTNNYVDWHIAYQRILFLSIEKHSWSNHTQTRWIHIFGNTDLDRENYPTRKRRFLQIEKYVEAFETRERFGATVPKARFVASSATRSPDEKADELEPTSSLVYTEDEPQARGICMRRGEDMAKLGWSLPVPCISPDGIAKSRVPLAGRNRGSRGHGHPAKIVVVAGTIFSKKSATWKKYGISLQDPRGGITSERERERGGGIVGEKFTVGCNVPRIPRDRATNDSLVLRMQL